MTGIQKKVKIFQREGKTWFIIRATFYEFGI